MTNINRKRNFSSLVNQAGKKLFTTTAITAVGLLSIAGNAQAQDAGPWDLEVTGGNFTKDFSKPQTNTITQLTDRAIGTGDADIDLNETVIINQKNSGSLFVARDNKADPTQILGNLKANGRVMVIDQNGVFFGADSNVNVGSIITSTGTTTDEDILDGDQTLTINSKSTDGSIINNGSITVADAGVAAFVSPSITNNGVIKAKMGKVVMASAETVTLDLHGDGLVEVAVHGELADGLIRNTGRIEAEGGEVLITASVAKNAVDNVINMDGVVDVSSVTMKGGKIILSGGKKGTVKVGGKLKANGTSTKAGKIDISGQNIVVADTAEVTADSANDAAGTVDVIANDTLLVDGVVSAQGLTGTGEVETSAPNVGFGAGASILATREWLLDPTDVTIDNPFAALIEAQLGLSDMTVQTPAAGGDAGDINVESVIDWSTASVFSLIAHNDINFNAGGGINAMGSGDFEAIAGGNIRLKAGNSGITSFQGDVDLISADEFTLADGNIIAHQGDVTIDNGQSFEALANSIIIGSGSVEINQNKDSNGLFTIANPTIQNAIDSIFNLGSGESIVNVGAGTWVESVKANVKNLVLNGANEGINPNAFVPRVAETIITPTGSEGIDVGADNVTIDGFTIDGAGVVGANGIHAKSVEDFRAVNNIIKNNMDTVAGRQASQYTTGNGILIEDAAGELFVAGNHLHDNEDGIQVLNSNVDADGFSYITHNVSEDNKDNGIVVKNSDNLIVQTNIVDRNKNGIWVDWSNDTYVGHNIIRDTAEDAIRLSNQTDNTLVEVNTIEGAGLHGIHTYVQGSHIIKHNVISDVTHDGIRIEKGTGHDVSFNTISDTGDDGIDVANVDMINLNYNDITDVDGNGISLQQTKDLKVTNNNITNAGKNGIVATDTTGVTDIYFNDIDNADEDGIRVARSVNPYIHTNTVSNTGGAGVHVDKFEKSWIAYNDVFLTGGHGIATMNGGFVSIYDNYVELSGYQSNAPAFGNTQVNSGADNIHVENIYGTNIPPVNPAITGPGSSAYGSNVEIYGNYVAIAADDNIQVDGTNSTYIADNIAGHAGDDGIDVDDAGITIVRDNGVTIVGDKGITIDGGQYAGVFDNRIALTGNDGIQVENVHGSQNAMIFGDIEYGYGWSVNVSGNEIAMTGDDGIEVIGSMYRETNVLVDINDVTNSGDNGIALLSGAPFFDEKREEISPSVSLISVGAPMNSLITGNTVVNSGNNGLFVGGPSHNEVTVSGNTFTDFDIGAHFESGRIDLTGEGNDLNGGRIGLRFAPAEIMPYYDDYLVSLSEPTFADMSLVDDTIGAQRFDGQSSFFVELDNGAFFDPGTPTFLRENDSTFVGTPFGTFTPTVDYPDGYPADVLAYLESKFYHFVDDGTLGLFFLEPLGEIDQEDVFNTFAPLSDGLGGLNVTLLGLPSIPGAPAGLNNIAPAAGGGTPTPEALNNIETAAGGETDPEALNAIETAAGGEQATCWGDALNTAGGGQVTTLSYSGSAEDLLNGEASCSNSAIN